MSVDITIQETIEEVDITINQNVIEVNVTRTSGGGGVQSVTGNVVDNTDPLNPVINITIPDVPTLQEVCDEGNSLLDTSIISETSSGESTAMTGGAIIFSNLSNPLTTYISNRTLQIVDSGNTATVLLPTPTDVGGTVIFPSVGSDIKTVAYAEDFPKSLEIKYIADQDVIQKADTAYYLVNNDENIATSNVTLNFDFTQGFVKDDVIKITKIAYEADGNSVLNINASYDELGAPPEIYSGVGYTTISSSGETIITLNAGDVVTFTFLSWWQVLVNVERATTSLELEFTQSGTADPIVTSLIGNRGATVTTAYVAGSQLTFTFDLPILANVKDSFKGDTNRNVFMTMAIGGSNQYFYSFFAETDYILKVEMFELVDGYINPADVGAVSPIRLKLDYKF